MAVIPFARFRDEYDNLAKKADGTVFQYLYDGELYRVETTPVSLTAVSSSGKGWYEYRLPKMPDKLIMDIYSFFMKVSLVHDTEALVRVYFDPAEERYVLEVPKQETTSVMVHTEEPLLPGLWPVMDIHSHNRLPAFFSATDDADEKGCRIFGVLGKIRGYDDVQVSFRVGSGGMFLEDKSSLELRGELFGGHEAEYEDADYIGQLLDQFENVHPLGLS